MRKLLSLTLFCCMVIGAQAQKKVSAHYQVGDSKVYKETSTTELGQGQTMKVVSTYRYNVKEATDEGYVIERKIESIESDAGSEDILAQIVAIGQELEKNFVLEYVTNKDGKITGVRNAGEVAALVREKAEALVGELGKNIPGFDSQKDMMVGLLCEAMSEEAMLKQMESTPNPFLLNGKTIQLGSMDQYVNENGVKMKRMYFLTSNDGKKIKTTSSVDMTADELKQFIVGQVEKVAPQQAEMVRQNIDMLMESGMMKVETSETADYEFFDDGWLKSVSSELKSSSMGQESNVKKVLEYVE